MSSIENLLFSAIDQITGTQVIQISCEDHTYNVRGNFAGLSRQYNNPSMETSELISRLANIGDSVDDGPVLYYHSGVHGIVRIHYSSEFVFDLCLELNHLLQEDAREMEDDDEYYREMDYQNSRDEYIEENSVWGRYERGHREEVYRLGGEYDSRNGR